MKAAELKAMKAASSPSTELRTPEVDRGQWAVRLLWLGAACGLVGMVISLPFAWDARDYILAVQHGSVYLHGQENVSLPYSPLFMIPTMRGLAALPRWLAVSLFGIAYILGLLAQIWAAMQLVNEDERKIFRYVAPVIAFFPGLLVADVILSGNIAYILYGMILVAAALGWKRERWVWFYVAVLAAACVKVHLLTMLAIPLLCGRRQWMRTLMTGAAGVSLYAVQSRMWPQAFHVYLISLKTMSQSRRDFGCAPTGILACVLQSLGLPYEKPCILFYAAYAIVMFLILLSLSRLYREHRVCFVNWVPVMLLGVVLLNPRLLTYDVAAVSLPMALVVWRLLNSCEIQSRKPRLIAAAFFLLALNIFVGATDKSTVLPDAAKFVEMLMMLGIFAIGVRALLKEAGVEWIATSSYMPASELASFDSADA
jgi:hypothetical protein